MVKQTRRFLASRGARKFRKNRSAMIALGVIGLYFLLTVWIMATSAIDRIGERVPSLDLSGRPVLGLLLPEMTQARVGPNELSGFGLRQSPRERLEHHRFWYDLATNTFVQIDRLDPDSDETPASTLAAAAVDDRGFLEDPVEAQAAFERLSESFERFATLNQAEVELAEVEQEIGRLRAQADELRRLDARFAELLPTVLEEQSLEPEDLLDLDPGELREQATPADGEVADPALQRFAELVQLRVDIENGRELLGFALEDIGTMSEAAAGFAEQAGLDTQAIRAIDLSPLVDSAEVLLDVAFEPLTPLDEAVEGGQLWDASITESLGVVTSTKAGEVAAVIEGQIDRIEPLVDELFPMPTGLEGTMYRLKLMLGTDNQGRSILVRGLFAGKVAIQVGFLTALVAVIFGSLLGAAAAFFSGWVDHSVIWLYSTLSSVPHLVLLVVLSFMFFGTPVQGTLVPLYAAFMLTFWIGPCRVIRGETLKIKELEYVQAATAIGFDRFYILIRHVIPNTSHLMFINFSLLFIGAIKSEVILTFLGLGLAAGTGSSWGTMIAQSKAQVAAEFFWQIGTATFFMFVLVLAFNILTDALQDAFDPKHVS